MTPEFSRPLKIDHIDRHGKKETIKATAEECAALAARFDVLSIRDLKADLNVKPMNGNTKFHVTGALTCIITQESIVSGDPVETQTRQDIEAWYADQSRIASFEMAKRQKEHDDVDEEHEIKSEEDDPEEVVDGAIDLGEVAAQFLGLAIDDFPRAEGEGNGDYIEVSEEEAKPNPFAVLAQLKDKK